MIDYYDPKLDVTLLGCGFLGSYYVGALYLLQQIWPKKPFNRVYGASCGGLIGALLLAGVSLERILDSAMAIVRQLHTTIRNPTLLLNNSIDNLLEQKLEFLLPKNAHELCSERLGVSLTKVRSLENKLVSQFSSRQELIDAVRAGCFIPIWSGSLTAPVYRGEQFMDGAYSDNCPRLKKQIPSGTLNDEDDSTSRWIAIGPFASDIDVAPRDSGSQLKRRFFGNDYLVNWKNLVRTFHAMVPCSVATYHSYMLDGHRNMKDYLILNRLIKCPDCWRNRATTRRMKSVLQQKEACLACLKLLEKVDSLKIPKSLSDIFKQ